MAENKKKLIVIGGVAGGTSAAARARRVDRELEIVIYEKGGFVSYDACDEPYYIKGDIESYESLLVRSPQTFEEKSNIGIRLFHEVTGLDPQTKIVTVLDHKSGSTFEDRYDSLVIASGAYPRTIDVPGCNLPGIFQMKFIDQAVTIKEFLASEKPKRAVIVGAGLVALEMAEALKSNGMDVTIVHRREKTGVGLEPEIVAVLHKMLDEAGVRFVGNAVVKEFVAGANDKVGVVKTTQGDIETDMVLLGIGVIPALSFLEDTGIELGPHGGLLTDERMETNIKGIFGAGDCCETMHRLSKQPIFTPLGDVANKHGRVAGANAAGANETYTGSIAASQFKCFDLEIGTCGLTFEEAKEFFDPAQVTIEHSSRAHGQPKKQTITMKLVADKKSRRLVGAQITGKEGAALRLNTLATIIQAGMTVDDMAELDFAYAPPFSPVIDIILMGARVLLKKLDK